VATPYVLPRYASVHRTGQHCGSTAMGNLIRWHTGAQLSEEAILGLSGAIWFLLIGPPMVHADLVLGRSIGLETGICEALGLPYREEGCADAEAWPRARDALADGPVVLMGDSSRLPYFGGPSFPGHRFLLVGHDEGRGVAILGDRKWAAPVECPLEALSRSRSDGSPLSANNLFGVKAGDWPEGREIERRAREAAPTAVRVAALRMLDPDADATGVRGIRRFARALSALDPMHDRELARRHAFVIEKGGNGGALFRRMYATFLREYTPSFGREAPSLVTLFEEIAVGWSHVANQLFAIADGEEGHSAAVIAAEVAALADREEVAWGMAAAMTR
jgi:hypothetical protein